MNMKGVKKVKNVYGPEYDFGSSLRDIRCKRNLTQTEVAKHLGIHSPTLSDYEHDKQKPMPPVLMDMAKLYNVDLNELMGHKSSINTKINNIYSNLSIHYKKNVIDYAEYLLLKQKNVIPSLTNYNKHNKQKTKG